MSALLFGPPGTSKTTVAKALAQKLDWPIVMLSPGTFIERGLEYIEAQAKIVFDQLLQLARTVVLFDECDELFRDLGIKHYQAFQTEHERAIRAEALAREAKLHALRNQLNPHFLFNTLNAVSTLTIQNNPIAANRMIGQLAAFLRMTLEEGNTTELPLSREVSMTEQYLQIEKARLGERLELQLAIAPEVRDALVPNMLLQPIVENAIRHGIAPATAGGKLTIQANQVDGRVQIRITDDGIGMKVRSYEDGTRRGGMGLATTIERLRVLYGNDHRFAVRWPQQGGCQVEIELPIHVQGRVLQDRSGVWIGNVSGVSRSQAQRT